MAWSYSKDGAINQDADAAWLDQVSYVPGATAPVIITNPVSQTSQGGQTISFQITAFGTPPLSYQWQFNGTNILDATNAILNVTNIPWNSEGNYSVVVSNAYGVVVSSNATLILPRSQVVTWARYNVYGQTNVPVWLTNAVTIAAGPQDDLALRSDGTVVGWGENDYGESTPPAGLSNVVAIAAGGSYFSLALKRDGTATVWGLGSGNTLKVPIGLSNIVAIAAGGMHCLALTSSHNIVAWGNGFNGETNVPTGLANVTEVAAGSAHSLALRSDGTVVAWGYNYNGETNVPSGLTNVVAIAAGWSHNLALLSNGGVVAWGDNNEGQTNVPAGLSNVVAIGAGSYHCLAIKKDGKVIAWGRNDAGQTNVPAGLNGVVAVTGGMEHSLALEEGGPLIIASQPPSQSAVAGTSTYISAVALGAQPVGYQWQFNGTNLTGATNALLNFANVQPANAGIYCLVASNSFGTVTSSNAILTVLTFPPAITTQPTNQTVLLGSNTTFAVMGTGTAPLTYQWQFNGTNIDWATNASLFLTNVQFANQGSYQVVVSNDYGSVISSNVVLTVISLAMALDAPDLVWTNGGNVAWFAETRVTHDGVAAAQSGLIANGQTSTLQTSVTGPGTLTFWWRFSSNFILDSLIFYVNGTQQAASSSAWQQKTFYLGSGTQTLLWTYSRSSSAFGNMSTGWVDQVVYTPGGTPPIVTLVPVSKSLMTRARASFSSSATGTPPISYQWQFNGTDLVGATNSSLVIANVQPVNSGTYALTITNSYGRFVTNVMLFVQPFVLNTSSNNPWLTASGLLMQVDGVLTPNGLVIYASTNLTSWLPILTNPPVTGSVRVLDSSATNLPFRFYRAGEQ